MKLLILLLLSHLAAGCNAGAITASSGGSISSGGKGVDQAVSEGNGGADRRPSSGEGGDQQQQPVDKEDVKVYIPEQYRNEGKEAEVFEGANVANDTTAAYLVGLRGAEIVKTDRSVDIRFSQTIADQEIEQYELEMRHQQAFSAEERSQSGVFYRVKKQDGRTYLGYIPPSQIQWQGEFYRFFMKGVGHYQLGSLDKSGLDSPLEAELLDRFKGYLVASDFAAGDEFGFDLDISGDWAIVGAPGKSQGTGAVYFFKYSSVDGWREMKSFQGSQVGGGSVLVLLSIAAGRSRVLPVRMVGILKFTSLSVTRGLTSEMLSSAGLCAIRFNFLDSILPSIETSLLSVVQVETK